MNIDELMSLNALLVSNALFLAAATIVLLRFQRMARQASKRTEAVAPATAAADEDLERRIRHLQTVADELARKEVLVQQASRHESSYESAARLVRMGASATDLSERCGLNRGEADLLTRLHTGTGQ